MSALEYAQCPRSDAFAFLILSVPVTYLLSFLIVSGKLRGHSAVRILPERHWPGAQDGMLINYFYDR